MGAVRSALILLAVAGTAAALVVGLQPDSGGKPASPCGPVYSTPKAVGIDAAAAATLCLLNRERTSRGIAALAPSAVLAGIAQKHSQDMVTRDYFEHTTPEGQTVEDRVRASGWTSGRGNSSAGENIEWGLRVKATPAATVTKWMASPPHRADILRPAFREIGIGIALGAPGHTGVEGATYTTDFGGVPDPSLQTG